MAPFNESSHAPNNEPLPADNRPGERRRPLALRMLLSVLAFSCAFSILASALWTYVAYDARKSKVFHAFADIERTLTPGIGKSLWELDNSQLKKYTDGICSNAGIKYARITADDGTVTESGTPLKSEVIVKEIPILNRDAGYSQRVGTLLLHSDRSEILRDVARGGGTIFLSQTAIVFCVAFFLFVTVNRLVTSHLLEIAAYIDALSHDPLSPPLSLKRNRQNDEFDKVVDAFNDMRNRLTSSIGELTQSREELRHKAEELFEEVEERQLAQEALQEQAALLEEEICERELAEESIRMLSQAVNQSPVSIVLTDPEGKILFVNPKFCSLTGFSEEEALGRTPRIIKSENTPEKVHQELWATITAGRVWDGTLQNKKKNGELFWERVTVAPIFNDRGEITRFMAIKEDITAHKGLEAQLFQSQKMEAVGHLAGGIAHDFNNILTAIVGFAHVVSTKMGPDDPQKQNMRYILDSADKAAELTRSLLVFSRKQIINPKPVAVNEIIDSLHKFLQRIIGEDVELRSTQTPEPLVINADRGQIEQVLMNLASNARDAMPKGGVLAVETQRMEMDQSYLKAHGYGKEGEYAVISVTDTGIGMDEATCKRIFEPFFSTKEVGKGTGLGMSIVYGIVKQHGGFVNVYSEPGLGTTFTVYLPLVMEEPVQKSVLAEEPLRGGTETVLVADDDPALRELVGQVLGEYGYRVLKAVDGEDAVEKFEACGEEIPLVILDIIMPKKNGKEVFDAVRALKPDCRALFLSGYTADIIHKRGVLDERLEFISKPFRPQQLLKKVREVLDA